MAWDDDKSTGDELTADEWDSHVSDQKTRAKNIVQNGPPSTSTNDDGALWSNSYVQYDSTSDLTTITDGEDILGAVYSEANDAIYFALAGGYVVSIDPSDGSQNWSHTDASYLNAFNTAYNATRNEVYFTVYDSNRVIALNASDGSFLWEHTHHSADYPRGIVADEQNGNVYSGADSGGEVVAADATDGSLVWSATPGSGTVRDLAYNPTDGLVYTPPITGSGESFALNDSDGTTNWTNSNHTGGDEYNAQYNSEDNLVYTTGKFNSGNNIRIAGIDGTTGADQWVNTTVSANTPYRGTYDSENNVIYIPLDNSNVVAYDGYDGDIIWNNTVLVSGEYSSALAYATSNNNLYAGQYSTDSLVHEVVQDRLSNLYVLLDGEWVINGN